MSEMKIIDSQRRINFNHAISLDRESIMPNARIRTSFIKISLRKFTVNFHFCILKLKPAHFTVTKKKKAFQKGSELSLIMFKKKTVETR